MPVVRSEDSTGPYYRWGDHGKKYYYTPNDKNSREKALAKAKLQERAAYANGYRGA